MRSGANLRKVFQRYNKYFYAPAPQSAKALYPPVQKGEEGLISMDLLMEKKAMESIRKEILSA